ncbi:MAG: YdcF family protein [Bacteroidetes bacterium]|nr:YdcF family protein [Bacteroidota bacterium]
MLAIVLSLILLLFFTNLWIIQTASGKNYFSLSKTPVNEVGLLLGTSKYNSSGQNNIFFYNRIDAAAALYHAGKIKHIIVSGDNRELNYNEPRDMRRALEKKGIPESAITLDFAGFRTLDSVIRSRKIFGQNKITIISQKFHVQRALFIADYYGIDAIGFCAQDPPNTSYYPIFAREIFARFKAVLDLYVLKQKPKFMGKQEKIIIN